MEKMRKVNETLQLLEIARHNLRDLSEACENERKLIFRALNVSDAEQVEDAQLYCIVNDLEYNAKDLADKVEEVESFIKDLERVKL